MHNTTTITSSSDGAYTLKTDKFDTFYHSVHGAYTEADVVFIQAGLEYFVENHAEAKKIRIFEMGFGSGLNVLKTYIWSQGHNVEIDYHTVEAYPLDITISKELNYGKDLNCQDTFDLIHQLSWEEKHEITPNFSFTKYLGLVEDMVLPDNIDVVYYDAFAPNNQPELWQCPILSRYYASMNNGGVLTTYCSQGEFRRQLIASGFTVEKIPGPNGKREMIRARK